MYKAKNNLISEKKEWNTILCETADALDHVHRCGYAHSDLKSNNVVLEKREDERLHPVIIDFGKSVLLIKAKNPPAKPMHVRGPGGGGYSPKIPIRVCAAQRGRDFGTPYLERGIHFRDVS